MWYKFSRDNASENPFLQKELSFGKTSSVSQTSNTLDIKFIPYSNHKRHKERLKTHFSPDTNEIKQVSDQYYPILISMHAPPPNLQRCSSTTCLKTALSETLVDLFCCEDCTRHWFCKDCLLRQHEMLPFHRISTWSNDDHCKISVTLAGLGLVLPLCHDDGTPCRSSGIQRKIQVFATTGLHEAIYYQCTCNVTASITKNTATATQLLANKLFPATSTEPNYAFTFDLLELFDVINLTGFINIKQFCDSILNLTPNEFTMNPSVCVTTVDQTR